MVFRICSSYNPDVHSAIAACIGKYPTTDYLTGRWNLYLCPERDLSNIPNGAAVYYTIDGSDPTISSTAITYDGTFTVGQSETIQATVHDTVTGWSTVASAVFVINTETLVQPPIISPNGGTFATAQTITLSNVPDTDTVYYTTDGSNPASSTTAVPYTGAFTANQSETVQAAIHDTAVGWSTVASAVFVINNSDVQLETAIRLPS